MFDPAYVVDRLTVAQRRRLVEIARADKALPWTDVDDDLSTMMLVGRYSGITGEPLASLGARGWQVLAAMARAGRK